MENKTLMKVSIVCSFLGILVLIFISENLELKRTDIGLISRNNLDDEVLIAGKVTSSKKYDNVMFLKVEDSTASIDVVIFEPDGIEIEKGSQVEIEGQVELYKDKLEIIARDIKLS